jgi:hypothetical protein
MLEQDVVAHRIDVRSQTVCLPQAVFTSQDCKNPRKNFLPYVVNCLKCSDTRAQLELDELAEIRHKMVLSPEVARPEPLQIGLIKLIELQSRCLGSQLKWGVFYTRSSIASGF